MLTRKAVAKQLALSLQTYWNTKTGNIGDLETNEFVTLTDRV
jgi:hypothetical protein